MEYKGKLNGISQDFRTGNCLMTFEIFNDTDAVRQFADLAREIEALRITVDEWKERRSLSANSYFHVLVGKIADVTGESKAKVKNELITSYGQMEFIDDEQVILRMNVPPELMFENEYIHLKLVKIDEDIHGTWYWYRQYRGSHTYDTKEMSVLINSTVELAQAMDIETKSEEEIERLVNAWHPSL